ncbi:kinase-like domain-containing protein [Cunninghamella echinulata]|nr:kinase-like domain-containing protein [Cunninghamella echinulata]
MPEYSAQTNAVCIDDFEILDEIGQGAYGLVKLAVLKSDETKKKVVIKYVIKSRILVDCWTRDRKLGMVPAEIHILHTLRKIPHDNCGDMMDYFEDDDYYYIVMELHGAGMDLFDYIELKDTMHESEIKVIFKQIALAVQHLHKHKIVHRDIKDENVVMDHRGGIRLIDYGSAAYIKSGRRYETFVGTLDYAAPEILKGHTYEGPPQDVWALGILLYTLIYRENPFYDIDEIMASELRVPFIFSDGLSVDLVQKMLERDVSKRLSIDEVLEHEWLAS